VKIKDKAWQISSIMHRAQKDIRGKVNLLPQRQITINDNRQMYISEETLRMVIRQPIDILRNHGQYDGG